MDPTASRVHYLHVRKTQMQDRPTMSMRVQVSRLPLKCIMWRSFDAWYDNLLVTYYFRNFIVPGTGIRFVLQLSSLCSWSDVSWILSVRHPGTLKSYKGFMNALWRVSWLPLSLIEVLLVLDGYCLVWNGRVNIASIYRCFIELSSWVEHYLRLSTLSDQSCLLSLVPTVSSQPLWSVLFSLRLAISCSQLRSIIIGNPADINETLAMRDPYKVVGAMLAEGCVDWAARIICKLLWLLFVLGSCLSAFIKRCSCSLVFHLSCRFLDHLVQLLIVSVIFTKTPLFTSFSYY
jgi:hypothetical protein